MTKSARAATCAAEKFPIFELPITPKFKSSRPMSDSSQLQDCPDKLVRIDGLGEVCLEASQPGQSPIFVTSCRVTGPIPDFPLVSLSQKALFPTPMAVIGPNPVMTTRLMRVPREFSCA
jgi:hypothetical protein